LNALEYLKKWDFWSTIFVRKTTHYFWHIVIHTHPHPYAPIVDLY
jgi:hypothetical protein